MLISLLVQTAGSWPDAIFAPVGGGGLISGIAAYIKEVAPSVKVIGVEAEGANILEESLKYGERRAFPLVNRFTEEVGIQSLGVENFRLCKNLVDEIVTVSTDEICSAIKDVFGDTRSLMEPSGMIPGLTHLTDQSSDSFVLSRCHQCCWCEKIRPH